MSNILAEVEGLELHDCDPHSFHCDQCEANVPMTPDYPNDLDACMRVAEKLECSVEFTPSGWIYIGIPRLDYEFERSSEVVIGSSRAATLYPMLVEIAEERKG